MFNKWKFLDEVKDHLHDEWGCAECDGNKFEAPEFHQVQDFISGLVENEVIYYYKAWAICQEFNPSDLLCPISGERPKCITTLAYGVLLDWVMCEIDLQPYEEKET